MTVLPTLQLLLNVLQFIQFMADFPAIKTPQGRRKEQRVGKTLIQEQKSRGRIRFEVHDAESLVVQVEFYSVVLELAPGFACIGVTSSSSFLLLSWASTSTG